MLIDERDIFIAEKSWLDVKRGDKVMLNPFIDARRFRHAKYGVGDSEKLLPVHDNIFDFEDAKGVICGVDEDGHIYVEWEAEKKQYRERRYSNCWWYLRDMLLIEGIDYNMEGESL